MVDSVEAAGFWLPSEFLDDFMVDKENLHMNNVSESDSDFCFPTEFPCDFGTKTNEFLQFSQKRSVLSTSPHSTLSNMSSWAGRSPGGSSNGSPNSFPSPPMTPQNDAVGDLIYLAAGQVTKLKLRAADFTAPTKHRGSVDQLYRAANKDLDPSIIYNIYLQQQMAKQRKQGCDHMWPQMHQLGMDQDALLVHPNPTPTLSSGGRGAAFGSGGGADVKGGCAGTGVFLPRRYGNNDSNAYASESRQRQGFSATSIPNRNIHALSKNFDNTNGFAQSQQHYHPKFGRGFNSEYDIFMAQRNVLMLQHRRSLLLDGSSLMNRGAYLPQEWTY